MTFLETIIVTAATLIGFLLTILGIMATEKHEIEKQNKEQGGDADDKGPFPKRSIKMSTIGLLCLICSFIVSLAFFIFQEFGYAEILLTEAVYFIAMISLVLGVIFMTLSIKGLINQLLNRK